MASFKYMGLNHAHRMRQNIQESLRYAITQIRVPRGKQGMPNRAGKMHHQQPDPRPANRQRKQPQTYAMASLEQERPETQHGDDARDFFFAGQREYDEKKAPPCLTDIEEIDGKQQERSCERLGMKIKREAIELCRVEQIQQGERYRRPRRAQPQPRQPRSEERRVGKEWRSRGGA